MGKPLRVLMVEDSDDDVLLMIHALKKGGYEPAYERVEDTSSMRKALEEGPWDIILCDFQMPRFNGLDAISLLKETDRDIPLIIVSGAIGEETAVECMRQGASDYVMKGSLSRLIPAVERELKEAESRRQWKQAERNLRESEERYRSLFLNSKDAILLTKPDGAILDANPAACQMFGRSLDEIRKMGRNGLVDVTDPRLYEALSERQRKGSEMAIFSMLRANGDKFPVEVTSTVFVDAAGQQKTSMIIRDITERVQARDEQKRLEAQLRHAQRMEAISTLAGGIAHDFNNILSAVMGYAQLAQMKLDRESEPYEDLKQVVQSANRAKLLIGQILAVGRGQEQERQPMQLKYTVKEALKLLRSTLPSTIEIREAYDKDVGIIEADPTQMHQVVMNLCTNAGHAMRKTGGVMAVSLQNEEIGERVAELNVKPGAYVRLSVSDTGTGMTPEVMERIFDPYFTTKERGEGTGIGLSVVHGIVTHHGGGISVVSEPGKGSVFHVYLPLTQAREEAQEVQEETPVPGGDERILFIDDEPALAAMGKQMLKGLGYEATATTGSLEALDLFRSNPQGFDLVITDTTMPHMPGDILAQELMKIRPDIPIIITTGHSSRVSEKTAREMGLKGFLMKPLNIRDLAETVRRALD